MNEVNELQKYIGQYGKSRAVYEAYRKSGWSQKFYDEHAADIILHRAAKSYFEKLGLKKVPSINQLKQEWATLAAEKKKLYSGYREAKETSKLLTVALGNANHILDITTDAQTRDKTTREAQDI
jgi:deferrochelatase/peroxidase EfeB